MIRILIENLLLFFSPTLLYLIYVTVRRRSGGDESPVLSTAPLVWLFIAGLCLMIGTLALFGTSSGGKPGEAYQPPIYKDGKIEPGHTVK